MNTQDLISLLHAFQSVTRSRLRRLRNKAAKAADTAPVHLETAVGIERALYLLEQGSIALIHLCREAAAGEWLRPELPPVPPACDGLEASTLPRYGLRWNGPTQPLSVPMVDGYWTPWHLAAAELAAMRERWAIAEADRVTLPRVTRERDALRDFAQRVMQSWPEGGIDGGELQELAESCGLLRKVEVSKPCGDGCDCENYGAPFPTDCYRATDLLRPGAETPEEAKA